VRLATLLTLFALVTMAGCASDPEVAFLPDADCSDADAAGQAAVGITVGVHFRSFDSGDLTSYELVRDEVDWLLQWAERHDLRLELAFNGYQAEGALASGEEGRYADMAAAGHAFGVHHHPRVRVDELTWIELDEDPTDEDLQLAVDDHRAWIGDVLDPLGIEYPGGHVGLTGRTAWWYGMMQASGYQTETVDAWVHAATDGVEAELDFDLLHPFRWQVGGEEGSLRADPSVPFVAIPQHPQVGRLGLGEHLRFDGSVPHLKTLLFLTYLEWRQAVLEGADPACWTFGLGVHPELGAAHNEDLEALATFVRDTFVEPNDDYTGRSMCGVTRSEVVESVEAIEDDQAPVFDFAPGDAYPYRLPQLARIYGAQLRAVHDHELDRGVRVLQLQTMSDPGDGDLEDLVPGDTALLVWADVASGTVEVDVSEWLDGDVVAYAGGGETTWSADAVEVGVEPVVIE